MEQAKKVIQYVCSKSCMCFSLFYKPPLSGDTSSSSHAAEEYEMIIHDDNKAEPRVAEKQPEEKWVADFESWTKPKTDQKTAVTTASTSPSKENMSSADIKRNLAVVDEETIIKKKVN